jgi:hypothetical protein
MDEVMVEVTVLPPQEADKQLTAKYVIKTLGEHAQAFMLANNINGFLEDDNYVLRDDRVVDILLRVSCTAGLTRAQVKRFAFNITKMTKEAKSKIPLSAALNLVARALGYHAYNLAHACCDDQGYIENLWRYGACITNQLFAEDDTLVKRKNQHAWQELVKRRRARNLDHKIKAKDFGDKRAQSKREMKVPIVYR